MGVPGIAGRGNWQRSPHHIAGIHIRLFDPFDDFEPAVEMLDDRGTTLDPVAAIHVDEAALASNCCVMNMTANHAVNITTPGFGSQGTLVLANEIDGILDLQLQPLREGPIGQTDQSPNRIEMRIEKYGNIVCLVTQQGYPARVTNDDIEQVTVNDQVMSAIRGTVHDIFNDIDAAEMRAIEVTEELVVIPGHVDYSCTFAALAQQLLYDVVMRLRPIPTRFELPAVDDISDKIDDVGIVLAKKVEQLVSLAAPRAEMNIG